mgnify:CR=1 FL=1
MQRAWGLLWKMPHVGLPMALASLLAVAALSAFPQVADGFSRYFDGAPIFLVLAAGATIGTLSIAVLRGQDWFQQAPNTTPVTLWGAMLFGVIIILADSLLRYPADINIAGPSALLFYPAIAIPAQAFLHLAPLAALVFLARRFGASNFWPPLLLASAIEPMFQVSGALTSGAFSSRDAFTMAHVYAFSVVEFLLLRRGGYAAMYGFRLCYYLVWHVLWGSARLGVAW